MQLFSKVLLVHRSNLLCEVLRESIEQRNYAVMAYATSGQDALDKSIDLEPDLLIISNALREYSGIEIVEKLKSQNFKGKLLFLSQEAKEACLISQRLGVDGHIHVFDGMSELFFAIQEIAAGRKYISTRVERQIRLSTKDELAKSHLDTSVLHALTAREVQIMKALSESNTTPQIAKRFLISPATVNNHRANIRQKLNLRGRNQLMSVAISLKPFYKKEAI